MTADYLVTNCRYWDGTSDYYDNLLYLAEEYLSSHDNPTICGFENYILITKEE